MWYEITKISNIINGPEKGLNYQSLGHSDSGWLLWWYDNNMIKTEEPVEETTHNEVMPEYVLFYGRVNMRKGIVTVTNQMKEPMLDQYFSIVQKALYQKFGPNIKIYKFFE